MHLSGRSITVLGGVESVRRGSFGTFRSGFSSSDHDGAHTNAPRVPLSYSHRLLSRGKMDPWAYSIAWGE